MFSKTEMDPCHHLPQSSRQAQEDEKEVMCLWWLMAIEKGSVTNMGNCAACRGNRSRKQIDRDIGLCLEYCFMLDETANHCKCLEQSCCQKLCATSALNIHAIIF